MSQFNKTLASHLNNAVAICPFAESPISIFLDLLLKQFSLSDFKSIGDLDTKFIKECTQHAYLLNRKEWDDRFTEVMPAELKFLFLKRSTIFNRFEVPLQHTQNFPTLHTSH